MLQRLFMRKNLLLVAIALTLSLVLAEIALRIAAPDLVRSEIPLLFMTHAQFRDDFGAIRFAPHQMARSAMIYGHELETDTRFQTNDMGFVDYRDYLPPAKTGARYVFVGDSYAAGLDGERPWIPALRDRFGIQAYALGMGGTGVLGFERMLQSISRQLSFTDVVFVAITDDLYRPLWRPLVRGNGVWLCPGNMSDQACEERWSPVVHLMRYDSTSAELIGQAREIRAEIARKQGALRTWLQNSYVLQLARIVVGNQLRQAGRRAALDESLEALARIRRAHPAGRIRFVHVPDRHETARGKYDIDLAPLLAGTGIDYLPVLGTCPWSMQRYLPNDNHPNSAGYEALAQCVAGMLGLERSSTDR